jgi:hypothetical protein
MSPREVSLRAEFRDWYPSIEPGVWYPAITMVLRVRRQQRASGPRWSLSSRVLDEEHFSFRGGEPRLEPLRTRRTDPAPRGRPSRDSIGE